MITPIAFDADNVIGMRIDGRIVAEDMDRIAAMVEEKLTRFDKLRVYVEVPSFEGISIEGFFKDLQLGLRHWHRFEKEAVVSDEQWMHKLAPLGGHLVSGLEVKVFASNESVAAKAWVVA